MERDIDLLKVSKLYDISTHTLTWSVTIYMYGASLIMAHFNSHAHVERDFYGMDHIKSYINFNSHAHVERDLERLKEENKRDDFNSHAHVERDRDSIAANNVFIISTHTLTWSVTDYIFQSGERKRISTHTLTWSVTHPSISAFFHSS